MPSPFLKLIKEVSSEQIIIWFLLKGHRQGFTVDAHQKFRKAADQLSYVRNVESLLDSICEVEFHRVSLDASPR
jgi:hypothetical protein